MVAEEEVVSPVQVEETVDVDRQIWENQQLLIQLLVQIHLLIGSKFVLNQRYVFCGKNGILNTKGNDKDFSFGEELCQFLYSDLLIIEQIRWSNNAMKCFSAISEVICFLSGMKQSFFKDYLRCMHNIFDYEIFNFQRLAMQIFRHRILMNKKSY